MRVVQINYVKDGSDTKYFTFGIGRVDFVSMIDSLKKRNYRVFCKYYTA